MKWCSLSEGETGVVYAAEQCSVCGALLLESGASDMIFFPDTRPKEPSPAFEPDERSFRVGEELEWLKREHEIDLTSDAEPVLVCHECTQRVDKLLRGRRA